MTDTIIAEDFRAEPWWRPDFNSIAGSVLSSLLIVFVCSAVEVRFAQAASVDYWTLPIPEQGPVPQDFAWPVSSLDAGACALCHPKQYEEWRTSFHARAASPGLLGQLGAFDGSIRTICLNCHAPRTEQQAALADSDTGLSRGIDCAGCHVRSHRRFGPRDLSVTPHGPVQEESLFSSSEFCAPCHQFSPGDMAVNGKLLENTLAEWRGSRYAAEGITCQRCHMPGGSHGFRGIHDPDMLRRGLALEVDRTPSGIVATVRNRGAGHALPTYITPRIRLLVHNPSRSAIGGTRHPALHALGSGLRLARTFRHALDAGTGETTRARSCARRDGPCAVDGRAGCRLPRPRISLPDQRAARGEISEAAMAQLRAAHAAAAATPYTAYRFDCGSARNASYRCTPRPPPD